MACLVVAACAGAGVRLDALRYADSLGDAVQAIAIERALDCFPHKHDGLCGDRGAVGFEQDVRQAVEVCCLPTGLLHRGPGGGAHGRFCFKGSGVSDDVAGDFD